MVATIAWVILFCLLLAVGWIMTLLALPGNWLLVAAAAGYAWLVSDDSRLGLGWPTVTALAVLAVVGELLELVAASRGVRQAGGSRWSALLALLGSVAGGFVGMFAGLPIPIVGPLIAAILFAGVGAALGAVAGESLGGRSLAESHPVGLAAFRGRLLGTVAKMIVGSVMVAVSLCALVVR
ncbi:MAG TPA: DUF456 domain-containing protein [Pirellulales bacterium]|nr:DUF456 domain-containing protein [Pirellulales bacterium]